MLGDAIWCSINVSCLECPGSKWLVTVPEGRPILTGGGGVWRNKVTFSTVKYIAVIDILYFLFTTTYPFMVLNLLWWWYIVVLMMLRRVHLINRLLLFHSGSHFILLFPERYTLSLLLAVSWWSISSTLVQPDWFSSMYIICHMSGECCF